MVPGLQDLGEPDPPGYQEMLAWWHTEVPEKAERAEYGYEEFHLHEEADVSPTLLLVWAIFQIKLDSEDAASDAAVDRFKAMLAHLEVPITPESVMASLFDDD